MSESDTNIKQLNPTTVERIAAGEVVERPASVVKELVENSLDADSFRIRVVAENGGTDHIRVTDDGTGMSEADVTAAVEKHTRARSPISRTSKRASPRWDFAGRRSRPSVRSRGSPSAPSHAAGQEAPNSEWWAGRSNRSSLRVVPRGRPSKSRTSFTTCPRVGSTSARSRRSSRNDVATGYALANPAVAVALEHNGRETFATTGQDDLEATTLAVYGREVAEAMLPIPENVVPDGPLDGLSGIISHPETTRSSPNYLRTYVNGRFVSAKTVRDAVVEAYDKQLGLGRYPFTVLYCELSAAEIDVNVHPCKREIRFAEEQVVHDQVEQAVETALLDHGLLRSSAPRGESAPEQATIHPERSKQPSKAADDTPPETPSSSGEVDAATDVGTATTVDHRRDRGGPSRRARCV